MQRTLRKSTLGLTTFLFLAVAVCAVTHVPADAAANDQQSTAARLFKKMGVLPVSPVADPIAFRLGDLNGRQFSMRDFSGKIVFLNFWTTWCPACIVEMPAMEKLHRKLKGRPFVMIAVNLQEAAATVKQFMEQKSLSFLTLLDTDGQLGRSLRVRQIPTTFIINGEGRIIGSALGGRQWGGEKSVALFEHLIENDSTAEN